MSRASAGLSLFFNSSSRLSGFTAVQVAGAAVDRPVRIGFERDGGFDAAGRALNFELVALRSACGSRSWLSVAGVSVTAVRIVVVAPVASVAAATTTPVAVAATSAAAITVASASTTAAVSAAAGWCARFALIATVAAAPRRLVAALLVESLVPCSERELRAAVHTYECLIAARC